MMVFNKMAVTRFPAECCLVALQMAFCSAFLLCFAQKSIHIGSFRDVARWSLVIPCFSGMLLTSMLALKNAPMSLLVVLRCLSPVAGLAVESFYPQPLQVNMGMIVSIFIMLCGSGLYASRMPRQHLTGVGWALLNTFFAVADRLLQRLMLAPDLAPVDISKCGVTLLNNLGGLVPVLLCAIATEEWKDVPHVSDLTLPSYSWLLASCVVGVGLSYTGIWCQSLISATSFLVLINASKFAIVCIEALFMNSYQLTWAQVLGALITIFGAVTFGQARESQSLVEKPPPETEPLLVPPARV